MSRPSSPASLTRQSSAWLPQARLTMEGLLCATCPRLGARLPSGCDTLPCPHQAQGPVEQYFPQRMPKPLEKMGEIGFKRPELHQRLSQQTFHPQ